MRCRSWNVFVLILGLTLVAGVGTANAQSTTAPTDSHHPPAAAPAPPPGPTSGQHDGTMPMMDMCRQMMAGPMMGMGADQKMDPKMMAHMLEMRGEMMKAMGEVMMKHGKMMGGHVAK